MGALPNAIVIGAAKAGTTSLCDDLDRHPDIHFYHSKETHYFSFNHHKGADWYQSLFAPAGEAVVMEGSPEYAAWGRSEEIAERIHALLPEVKLLYMVRDPLPRIASMYVQEVTNTGEALPFSEALRAWPRLIDGSLYERNYRIFADRFGAEQIHVVFLDDYRAGKEATLRQVCGFLGIASDPVLWQERAAKNTRDEKYFDHPLMRAARKLPGFYQLKRLVSQEQRARLRQRFGQKVEIRADWSAQDRAHALELVAPDARAFLARFDKPATLWALEA